MHQITKISICFPNEAPASVAPRSLTYTAFHEGSSLTFGLSTENKQISNGFKSGEKKVFISNDIIIHIKT